MKCIRISALLMGFVLLTLCPASALAKRKVKKAVKCDSVMIDWTDTIRKRTYPLIATTCGEFALTMRDHRMVMNWKAALKTAKCSWEDAYENDGSGIQSVKLGRFHYNKKRGRVELQLNMKFWEYSPSGTKTIKGKGAIVMTTQGGFMLELPKNNPMGCGY